jgi:hypothetical protein
MGMNEKNQSSLVYQMAKATGVVPADVKKILTKLGLDRIEEQAIASNGGKAIKLASARVALKVGKSTVIV